MSLEVDVSSRFHDATEARGNHVNGAFSCGDGFLGIAMRAAQSGRGIVRAVLDGVGDVTIDAENRRFIAQVDDWSAFCAAPTERIRVTRRAAIAPSAERWRDLSELLWTAGYHASAGRLPVEANRIAVVRLSHWPNLSRLPCTPDMYRLCALLARRPSSIHLAAKLVGVEEAQAFRFFSAAQVSGVIVMATRSQETSSTRDDEAAAAAPPPEASLASMVKLLWNKMTRN